MDTPFKELANWVDDIFRANYTQGDEYPVFHGDSDKPSWETHGDDPEYIISEILESDFDIAEDVKSLLSAEEGYAVHHDGATAYYNDTTYVEIPIHEYEYSSLWKDFLGLIKHQSRFFNSKALDILDGIFKDIDRLDYYGEKAPIRNIGSSEGENFIYRARRAQSSYNRLKICLDPAQELGPPPPKVATGGRMNPAGIPAFYGSFDRPTCLAEIRLAVGEIAVSGKFEIVHPIKVLDITVLNSTYSNLSLFDPDFESKARKLKFLIPTSCLFLLLSKKLPYFLSPPSVISIGYTCRC